jgi:DNA-binding response OmpR family regulator
MKLPIKIELGRPAKILIVEDEEILANVLKEKFEKEKLGVLVANDGESVLAMAKELRPDIILLDLILPAKNGFEVLKELKADADLKNIPVVVLSNLGQDEEIKSALKLGAEDYLVKTQHPVKEVVERVKAYLIKSR